MGSWESSLLVVRPVCIPKGDITGHYPISCIPAQFARFDLHVHLRGVDDDSSHAGGRVDSLRTAKPADSLPTGEPAETAVWCTHIESGFQHGQHDHFCRQQLIYKGMLKTAIGAADASSMWKHACRQYSASHDSRGYHRYRCLSQNR